MTRIRSGFAIGVALSFSMAVSMVPLPAQAGVPSPRSLRTTQDPAPVRDEAAVAFSAGERAFAAGDYPGAVEHFSRAQELLPHPFTAYNLGLAQARSGLTLEAWHTFRGLQSETDDPERLMEIEVQLARLSPSVARLQVHASEGQVVRVDGNDVEAGTILVRPPGPLRIEVDTQAINLELRGGELRHVEFRAVDRPAVASPPNPATSGVLAAAVVFGAGTAGTATAAAWLTPERVARPLGFTAAGLAGATVALAATALALHVRDRRSRKTR